MASNTVTPILEYDIKQIKELIDINTQCLDVRSYAFDSNIKNITATILSEIFEQCFSSVQVEKSLDPEKFLIG